MENRQYNVKLYLYDKPLIIQPIEFYQNDTESCSIEFEFNSDRINKFDLTNKIVEIRVTKPDLTTVDDVATITGLNTAVWELKLGAISTVGSCVVTIYVYENTERLTFGTLKYKVIADTEAGNVGSQPEYPILTQLIADVQDAINETNQTSDNISAVEATRVSNENTRIENEENRNTLFNSKVDEVNNKITEMDVLEDSLNTSEATRVTEFNEIKNEYQTALHDNTSIEVVNARQGKANLGENITDIKSQLAESLTKNPIYITDYGVNYTKSETENTPLILQAITDAKTQNRPIIFPWIPEGQWLKINQPLIIDSSMKIKGFGLNTRIKQMVFPNQVFKITGQNVEIEDFFLSGANFDASGTGASHVTYCGVDIQSNNAKVKNIKGDNLSTVIRVGGIVGTTLTNISVENIECSNVVFGLLVGGVDGFYFNNIKGSYKYMTGVATPPHLLYFSDGYTGNNNINGGNCFAFDSLDSYSFQFKDVKNSFVSNFRASKCKGVLFGTLNSNLVINNVRSENEKNDFKEYGAIELQSTNTNVTINGIYIDMDNDGKCVQVDVNCDSVKLKNVELNTKHNVDDFNYYAHDLEVKGSNCVIENPIIKNKGTNKWSSCINLTSGTNNKIINPKCDGNKVSILNTASTSCTILDLDLSDLKNSVSKVYSNKAMTICSRSGKNLSPNILAFDNFDIEGYLNQIQYTSSGHLWVLKRGEFKPINKKAFNTYGFESLAVIDTGTANISLSSTVKVCDREGIAIKSIDFNNMIWCTLDHTVNKARIVTKISGTTTVISEAIFNVQLNRCYDFKVIVYGNIVDFYINNSLIVSATLDTTTMNTFGTITTHGIFSRGNVNGNFSDVVFKSVD